MRKCSYCSLCLKSPKVYGSSSDNFTMGSIFMKLWGTLLFQMGSTLVGKYLLLQEKILPFKSLSLLRRKVKKYGRTRNVFQRKTDVLPPTHSHPYFSALSAFPSICFIVQIFALLIYSFEFGLCKDVNTFKSI